MHIDIQAHGFRLTPALEYYTRNRLQGAMHNMDSHLVRISARLLDVNGPRGGADKRCQVQVVLKQRLVVVVQDLDEDLYHAIDRACGRAGRAAARQVERLRETRMRQRKARIEGNSEYLEAA